MRRLLPLALVLVVMACASAPKTTAPVYRPTLDYRPPELAEPASAGVTIALLDPQYPSEQLWYSISPSFVRSMHKDLEEILTARGLTLRGTFSTHDDMLYADKRDSDLVLTPIIELSGNTDFEVDQDYKIRILGKSGNVFKVKNGTVTLAGRVTLAVSESFTGERLWSPSIPVPPTTATFVGVKEYERPPPPLDLEAESGLRSALGQALDDLYVTIMTECWTRLDPRELKVYKAQADEIKQKTVFSGR